MKTYLLSAVGVTALMAMPAFASIQNTEDDSFVHPMFVGTAGYSQIDIDDARTVDFGAKFEMNDNFIADKLLVEAGLNDKLEIATVSTLDKLVTGGITLAQTAHLGDIGVLGTVGYAKFEFDAQTLLVSIPEGPVILGSRTSMTDLLTNDDNIIRFTGRVKRRITEAPAKLAKLAKTLSSLRTTGEQIGHAQAA